MNRAFIMGLIALVAALGAAYWLLLGRDEGEVVQVAPASLPASLPIVSLRVQELQGRLVRRDTAGKELALQVGEAVALSDELRTDGMGQALLTSEGTAIRLGPDTQLQVRKQNGADYELFVAGGSVEASSDGPRLELFGSGTSGLVRIENGAARIFADGVHGMVVGSERGKVEVENGGQRLIVPVGQATRLLADRPPDPLWKLPPSVLLKVAWPKTNEIASRKLQVTGTAMPGALLRVQGQRALVDRNGRFAVDVSLSEGVNAVRLSAEDPRGAVQSSQFKVKVDTTPAEVGVETSPEMWRKKH